MPCLSCFLFVVECLGEGRAWREKKTRHGQLDSVWSQRILAETLFFVCSSFTMLYVSRGEQQTVVCVLLVGIPACIFWWFDRHVFWASKHNPSSNPLWTSRGKKKQAAPKTIVLSNHPKLGYLFWNSLWLDFQGMFFVANWTHSHWISSWDQPRSSHPRRPCGDGGHTTCLRLLSVEIQYVKDPRATIFGII